MTPAEFSAALAAIGWSQRQLAGTLECDHKIIQRWAGGQAPIPAPIARWLDRIAGCHERYPPPNDWRVYVYE